MQSAFLKRSLDDLFPDREIDNFKKAKPDISPKDVKSWEISARKTRVLSSALDWQLAATIKMLQRIADTTPVPGLDMALRLMLSAGKTTYQIQRDATANLSNCLLKKRDAVLPK